MAFYSDGVHAALLNGDWDEALRYTGALESCTGAEPFARGRLAVARARALVALGREGPTEQTLASLTRLRVELVGAGMGCSFSAWTACSLAGACEYSPFRVSMVT
jgi:hypothetical protein